MGFENIEKPSSLYHFLKKWVRFWHDDIFYRKVTVLHPENIPPKGHLIFTPNHQNALMDALALLFTVRRRMVFMARSDIFKKRYVAAILYFLRILPIYRIRDGYDSLKKNKASFQKTIDVLASEESALVILPEGNHAGIRRLRPLKKGFARIAFQAEEAMDFTLDIHIVPVGIDYSNYENCRSNLTINFGKSIAVSHYYEQYKEAPAIAINAIKNELSKQIKKLIIHIETETFYDLFDTIRKLYLRRYAERIGISVTSENSLFIQQSIVNQLDKSLTSDLNTIDLLNNKVNQYVKKLKQIKAGDKYEVQKPKSSVLFLSFITLLVSFPVYIYGLLNNMIPIAISLWAKSKIKDPQFKSSFLFVISMIAFPLLNILQTIFISFFVPKWYWIVIYFFSVPASGLFVRVYHNLWHIFRAKLRLCFLFRKKKAFMEQMQKEYTEIINLTDNIIRPETEE